MKVNRGQPITFEKILKNADGTFVPIAKRVDVCIKDLNGVLQWQGPASVNYDSGNWQVTFIVPMDAALSTADKSWTIDWSFVTDEGTVINIVTEFDVVEETEELPERFLLLPEDFKSTVSFCLPEKATSVELEIIDEGDHSIFSTTEISDFNTYANNAGYTYEIEFDTRESLDLHQGNPHDKSHGGHIPKHGYLDGGMPRRLLHFGKWQPGRYIFRFSYRIPSKHGVQYEIVLAHIVANNYWRLYPSVMTILDKARKKQTLVSHYSMGDVHEYLLRGIAMINIAPPQITNWNLQNFPIGGQWWGGLDLSHFLVTAACLVGLQSQVNMYSDLGFAFSGQTITLDYDPSSALGGMIDTYLHEINEKLPSSKELVLRRTQKTALVGIRQQFYQHALSRLDILRKGLGMAGTLSDQVGQRFLL
jgi:hypothetical protein